MVGMQGLAFGVRVRVHGVRRQHRASSAKSAARRHDAPAWAKPGGARSTPLQAPLPRLLKPTSSWWLGGLRSEMAPTSGFTVPNGSNLSLREWLCGGRASVPTALLARQAAGAGGCRPRRTAWTAAAATPRFLRSRNPSLGRTTPHPPPPVPHDQLPIQDAGPARAADDHLVGQAANVGGRAGLGEPQACAGRLRARRSTQAGRSGARSPRPQTNTGFQQAARAQNTRL